MHALPNGGTEIIKRSCPSQYHVLRRKKDNACRCATFLLTYFGAIAIRGDKETWKWNNINDTYVYIFFANVFPSQKLLDLYGKNDSLNLYIQQLWNN